LNPAGAFALLRRTKRSVGRVCRTSALIQTYTSKRKTPAFGEGLSFGRTSQIRTGDLYHVKAAWPHQDTRGHSNFSGMLVQKATLIALRIGQLVNKTNPSNGSVAPK